MPAPRGSGGAGDPAISRGAATVPRRPAGVSPQRTPINPENAPGFDSFAFEVDDLDGAISELDGRVEWANPDIIEWKHPIGTWYRYRPFYDPGGNMLYVTEPHKASG